MGKNVLLDKQKGIKERNQLQIKGIIWCNDCERTFNEPDTFSKNFFENKYGIESTNEEDKYLGKKPKTSKYKSACIELLYNFVISVVIRHDQYLRSKNDPSILGPKVQDFICKWKNGKLLEDFDILIQKLDGLDGYIEYPFRYKYDEKNTIRLFLESHIFIILTDQRKFNNKINSQLEKIKSGEIFEIHYEHSPLMTKILENFEELRNRN
ncbi:MAG: hypothetical protein Q7U04_06725 [Bacteriovorax sp.]|nr:hypothetical protein [Bacteriovorax sp.]